MTRFFGDPPPSPLPHDWGAAPCLDLINSRWSNHLGTGASYDRLPVAKFRRTLLNRWNFKVDDPDDPDAIRELARLRGFLRRILERYADHRSLTGKMRQELEAELNRARLRVHLKPVESGIRIQQAMDGKDWDVVMAELAMSAARLIANGQTVKVCSNPDCTWMFVDESKPHSRRWCNAAVCGSLVNVRRFRLALQSPYAAGPAVQPAGSSTGRRTVRRSQVRRQT